MSYFAAGYSANTTVINDFEKSFIDVLPGEIKNDICRIQGNKTFLLSYGANKVIKDVVICIKHAGSWLALLGTPLVQVPAEDNKALFLENFFSDPKRTINNEFDGCFALLAYDASTDTLIAATDYNNTTPIYYATTPKGVFVSSHELQLARLLQSEIDPLGFSMTIQMKLTWGTQTRFKNISKMPPCQIMTFRGQTKHTSEFYWRPSSETQWHDSFDDVISRWLTFLKTSVAAYYDCSSEKTVICDFTAGEDSRLILSQCHALGYPFQAMVDGLEKDIDVVVSKEAARQTGFDLVVRPRCLITEEQLLNNATQVSLMHEAYQDYFQSCTDYATERAMPSRNYLHVKYCGAPGGEAFRGAYYLRGKAFFPSSMSSLDHRFFTRMKYLLDFYPGLLCFPDEELKKIIFTMVEEALKEVKGFPCGTKIDHLLRMFQTCNAGLIYKNPRYLPFATKNMTRSIYTIPPHFKRGGRLTKACTEILYPELAVIKTQKGVPTIRKTLSRSLLFMPEYVALVKSVMSGAFSRLLKLTESNKPSYKWTNNAPAIMTLLHKPPYVDWFSSSQSMVTGYLYNENVIGQLFADAKAGSSRYVPILGRIINQELACRWVYRH
jgi:hypothetical protein